MGYCQCSTEPEAPNWPLSTGCQEIIDGQEGVTQRMQVAPKERFDRLGFYPVM